MIEITAYAKVNLFLEVTGKLSNGYHTVDTVMQSVSLADKIRMELMPKRQGITISSNISDIPLDDRNIAYKAARAFLDKTNTDCGVSIHIHKSIPTEAGMGGGSADGAAVLRGLNMLCGYPITDAELSYLAAEKGADIPFCLHGGTQHLVGIGTELVETIPSPKLHLVVAKPSRGISTPSAYAYLDGCHDNFVFHDPIKSDKLLRFLRNGNTELPMFNRFEETLEALCPESLNLIDHLNKNSYGALLSGSGTAVFAIAESSSHAQKISENIKNIFPDHFVTTAQTVNTGCIINTL